MKIIKRFIVVLILISVSLPSVYARASNDTCRIDCLVALDLVHGDCDGDFHLDDYITRAEFATLLCNFYNKIFNWTIKDVDSNNSYYKFKLADVNEQDWYYNAAYYATKNFYLIDNYTNESIVSFMPNERIQFLDYRRILSILCLEWMTIQEPFENITREHYPKYTNDYLTRKQAFLLFYDFINEYERTVEHDTNLSYTGKVVGPVHKIYNTIDTYGNASGFQTLLTMSGYYTVYAKIVDNDRKTKTIKLDILESDNFQNIAYGTNYTNHIIIDAISNDDYMVGEFVSAILRKDDNGFWHDVFSTRDKLDRQYSDIW